MPEQFFVGSYKQKGPAEAGPPSLHYLQVLHVHKTGVHGDAKGIPSVMLKKITEVALRTLATQANLPPPKDLKLVINETGQQVRVFSSGNVVKKWTFQQLGLLLDVEGNLTVSENGEVYPEITFESLSKSLAYNLPHTPSARLRYMKDCILDTYRSYYLMDFIDDIWQGVFESTVIWHMLSIPWRVLHFGIMGINLLANATFALAHSIRTPFPQLKRDFALWLFNRGTVPLSLAETLEGLIQFLKTKTSKTEAFDKLIREYEQCRGAALEIEKIKTWSTPYQLTGITRLAERASQSIKKLKDGDKHLLPGGYIKEGKLLPLLYEFEKIKGEEKIKLRIIGMSTSPSAQETGAEAPRPIELDLPLERATDAALLLQPLLELQLPAVYKELQFSEVLERVSSKVPKNIAGLTDKAASLQDHWALRSIGPYAAPLLERQLHGPVKIIANLVLYGTADINEDTLIKIIPELQAHELSPAGVSDEPTTRALASRGKIHFKTAWILLKTHFASEASHLKLEIQFTVIRQLYENEKQFLATPQGENERLMLKDCLREWTESFKKHATACFGTDAGVNPVVHEREILEMKAKLSAIYKDIEKLEARLKSPSTDLTVLNIDADALDKMSDKEVSELAAKLKKKPQELLVPRNNPTTNHGNLSLNRLDHLDNYNPIITPSTSVIIEEIPIDWEGSPQEALEAFKQNMAGLTALYKTSDEKKWAMMDAAAVSLLNKLPIPTSGAVITNAGNFWNTEAMPPQEITEWSDQVTLLREYLWKANHVQQANGLPGAHVVALARSMGVLVRLAERNSEGTFIGDNFNIDLEPLLSIQNSRYFYFANKEQEDDYKQCLDYLQKRNQNGLEIKELNYPLAAGRTSVDSRTGLLARNPSDVKGAFGYAEQVYQKLVSVDELSPDKNPSVKQLVDSLEDVLKLPTFWLAGLEMLLPSLKVLKKKIPPKFPSDVAPLRKEIEKFLQKHEKLTGAGAAKERLAELAERLRTLDAQLAQKREIPLTEIGKMYSRGPTELFGAGAREFTKHQQKMEILGDLRKEGYNAPQVTHLRLATLQMTTLFSNRNCYYGRGIEGMVKELGYIISAAIKGDVRFDRNFFKDVDRARSKYTSELLSQPGDPRFTFRRETGAAQLLDLFGSGRGAILLFIVGAAAAVAKVMSGDLAKAKYALLALVTAPVAALQFIGMIATWLIRSRFVIKDAFTGSEIVCEPYGLSLESHGSNPTNIGWASAKGSQYQFTETRDAQGIGKPLGKDAEALCQEVVEFDVGKDDVDHIKHGENKRTEIGTVMDGQTIGDLSVSQSSDLKRTKLRSTSIEETLDYYTENAPLLERGEHQRILELGLFRYNALSKRVKENPALIIKLNRFIHQNITMASAAHKVPTLLFLSRLSTRLYTYIPKELVGEYFARNPTDLYSEVISSFKTYQTHENTLDLKEVFNKFNLENDISNCSALRQELSKTLDEELIDSSKSTALKELGAFCKLLEQFGENVPDPTIVTTTLQQCTKQLSEGTTAYQKHRTSIHRHLLASYSEYTAEEWQQLSPPELQAALQSYFAIKDSSEEPQYEDATLNEEVQDVVLKMLAALKERLKESSARGTILNALLKERFPHERNHFWNESGEKGSGALYSSGEETKDGQPKGWEIDLAKGLIYKEQQQTALLPYAVTHTPSFRRLFGEENFTCQIQHAKRTHNNLQATIYSFERDGAKYRTVYQDSGQEGTEHLEIYKQILDEETGEESFHQWMPLKQKPGQAEKRVETPTVRASKDPLPQLAVDNICWVNCDKPSNFRICDEKGTVLYTGKLRGSCLYQMQNAQGKEGENYKLHVWGKKWTGSAPLANLTRLAPPEYIELLGTAEGKAKSITYHNYNETFIVDARGRARSAKDKHFILSKKEELNIKGMDPKFQQFQILEHDQDHREQVLIAANEIIQISPHSLSAEFQEGTEALEAVAMGTKTAEEALNDITTSMKSKSKVELLKSGFIGWFRSYFRLRLSAFFPDDNYSKPVATTIGFKYTQDSELLSFEIDPQERRLSSKSKEGHLYLTYLFLSLKQYKEAMYYLSQAKTSLPWSDKAKKTIAQLLEWNDPHPNALALKFHLNLMYCQNQTSLLGEDLKKQTLSFSGMRCYTTLLGLQEDYEKLQEFTKRIDEPLKVTSEHELLFLELFSKVSDVTKEETKPRPEEMVKAKKQDPRIITPPHLNVDGRASESQVHAFSNNLYYAIESKFAGQTWVPARLRASDKGFVLRSGRDLVRNFDDYYAIASGDPNSAAFKDLQKRLPLLGDKDPDVKMARWYLYIAMKIRESNTALTSWPKPSFTYEAEGEGAIAAKRFSSLTGFAKYTWTKVKRYTYLPVVSLFNSQALRNKKQDEIIQDFEELFKVLDLYAEGRLKEDAPQRLRLHSSADLSSGLLSSGSSSLTSSLSSSSRPPDASSLAATELALKTPQNKALTLMKESLGDLTELGPLIRQMISKGTEGATLLRKKMKPALALALNTVGILTKIEDLLETTLQLAKTHLQTLEGTREEKRALLVNWIIEKIKLLKQNDKVIALFELTKHLDLDLDTFCLLLTSHSKSIADGILLALDTRSPEAIRKHLKEIADRRIDAAEASTARLERVQLAIDGFISGSSYWQAKLPEWKGIYETRGVTLSSKDYSLADPNHGLQRFLATSFVAQLPDFKEAQPARLVSYLCNDPAEKFPPEFLYEPEQENALRELSFLRGQLVERLPHFLTEAPPAHLLEGPELFSALKERYLQTTASVSETLSADQVNAFFDDLTVRWSADATKDGSEIPAHRKYWLDHYRADTLYAISQAGKGGTSEVFKLGEPKDFLEVQKQLAEFSQLKNSLVKEFYKASSISEKARAEALSLVNNPPLDPVAQAYKQMRITVEKEEETYFPELKRLWLQGRLYELRAKHPHLTNEMLAQLDTLLTSHLSENSKVTVVQRMRKTTEELEENLSALLKIDDTHSTEYKQLLGKISASKQLLADMIKSKRAYTIDSNHLYSRACLMIENINGFMVRPDQVLAFFEICKDPTKAIQLIMGAGKTSVGNVVIVLMLATGHNLPIWVGPKALFAENSNYLDTICREHFGREPFKFSFERNMPMDSVSLQNILLNAQRTVNQQGFMMSTRESIQACELKYLQNIADYKVATSDSQRKELALQDEYLTKLLRLLRGRGYILNDEIDSVHDPAQQYIFASGATKLLGTEPIKIQTCVNAFRFILNDPTWRERLKISANFQHNLSEEGYADLKQFLATCFFASLEPKGRLKQEHSDVFARYVTGDPTITDIPEFLKEPKELLEEVGVIKDLLTGILPGALKKKGNVNFGRELVEDKKTKEMKKGQWVVPFISCGKPKPGSVHGNDLERTVFHIINYIQDKISLDQIRGRRDILLQEALELRKHEKKPKGSTTPEQTWASYGWTDVPLLDVTEKDLETIVSDLTAPTEDNGLVDEPIFQFLEKILLPEIEKHTDTLESNSQNFSSAVKFVCGFSGTTGKAFALSDKINDKLHTANRGTDGRTLEAILRKATPEGGEVGAEEVQVYSAGSAEERIKELLQKCEGANFFVDGGAALDFTNPQEFASIYNTAEAERQARIEILDPRAKEKAILGVVYFNKEDRWVAQFIGQKEPVPVEKLGDISLKQLFTLYDHAHRIGADRPQAFDAEFPCTGDAATDFEDAAQSWARARGLWTQKQKPRHLVSEETKKLIKGGEEGPLLTKEYLGHLIKNQADGAAKAVYKGSRQKITNIVRNQLIELMQGAKNMAARSELLEVYRTALFKISSDNIVALADIDEMKEPKEALCLLIEAEKARVTKLLLDLEALDPTADLDSAAITLQTKKLKGVLLELEAYSTLNTTNPDKGILPPAYYPTKVAVRKSETVQTEMTVEQQQEQEEEQEEELSLPPLKTSGPSGFKGAWSSAWIRPLQAPRDIAQAAPSRPQSSDLSALDLASSSVFLTTSGKRRPKPALHSTISNRDLANIEVTTRAELFFSKAINAVLPSLDSMVPDRFRGLFDRDIRVTHNLMPVFQKGKPLTNPRKPIHDVLVVYNPDKKEWKLVLCDAQDKDDIVKKLLQEDRGRLDGSGTKIGHYSIRARKIDEWGKNSFTEEEQASERFLTLITQCHFFAADAIYRESGLAPDSPTEYKAVAAWLSKHPYEKTISCYRECSTASPHRAKKYAQSPLRTIFREIEHHEQRASAKAKL